MITLDEKEAVGLLNTLNEIPHKYAAPMFAFIQQKLATAVEAQKAQAATEQANGQPVEG